MVPVRVTLENFLAYDEAVFDFEGARLWSVWGDNGAGKSAIFDAITYCLYGVHRGGAAQGADAELLRKGATRMSAALELDLGTARYRVTRTLSRRRRRSGDFSDTRTQQVDWLDPDDGLWRAVPGTEGRGGLADWVRDRIGMGYETFVASVLLLQGQSDRLLQAKPDQRFTILSDLIDLAEYERLEGMAREEARDARARHATLEAGLEAAPAVGDEELAAAEAAFAAAEAEMVAHRERVAQAIRLVEGARAHARQVLQVGLRRTELAEMRALISDAEAIRAQAAEHVELAAAVRPVTDALAALAGAGRAEATAAERRARAGVIDVAGAETARAAADALAHQAARAASEAAAAPGRLRREREDLAPLVAAERRLARLGAELGEGTSELEALDGELVALPEVDAALAAADALSRALPLAGQLARDRREAAELLGRLDGEEPGAALARARAAHGVAVTAAEAAGREHELALTRRHDRHAAVNQLGATLAERREARTEGTCSHCGQPVDAAHIEVELRSAEVRLAGARESLATAERELGGAGRAVESDREAVVQRQAAVRALEDLVNRIGERTARSAEVAEQLLAVPGLPAWAAALTRAPAGELPALVVRVREEAGRAGGVRRERERLLEVGYRRESLAATLDQRRAEVSELEAASVPLARAAAVAREAELAAALVEADAAARGAAARMEALRAAAEERRRALEEARARRSDLDAAAAAAGAEAAGLRREAALRLEPMPAAWRERALAGDGALAAELEARLAELAEAPALAAALEPAEREVGARQDLLRELEEALERTPPAHRVPVEEAERAQREQDALTEDRQEARDGALRARDRTRQQREERRELEERVQDASRTRRRWEQLARLLGRGGLQARLMDEALTGIEHYANETLREISTGQLEVRLRWSERAQRQEISIQAVDLASSDEPVDVAFISGGQKFRTAVALAAGIGRYAGGALRALVIDEGFGSLDQQGRIEVIEQLREIASVMDRVIVVSHHEDFQDRRLFPAGYVLRREGRRTSVTRAL
jgi:DNA repair exonuclease SbcCD ATPase subunit